MSTLSSLLVQRGVATIRDVEEAIGRQVLHGGDLATNLLELRSADEAGITRALADFLHLEAAPPGRLPAPSREALRMVPAELAQRHQVVPLALEDGTLVVVTSEPLASSVEEDLGFALDVRFRQLAAPLARVKQALFEHYGIELDRRTTRLLLKLDGAASPTPSLQPHSWGLRSAELPRAEPEPPVTFGPFAEAPREPSAPYAPSSPHDPTDRIATPPPPPMAREDDRVAFAPPPSQQVTALTPLAASSFALEAPPPSIERAPFEEARHTASMTGVRFTEPFEVSLPPSFESAPVVPSFESAPAASLFESAPAASPIESPRAASPPSPRAPSLRWVERVAARDHAPSRAARRKGPFTVEMAERELGDAGATEAVLDTTLAFAGQFFEHVALFTAHGDVAEGRDSYGAGADRASVATLHVPLSQPSILAAAREGGVAVVAPLASEVDVEVLLATGRAGAGALDRAVAALPIVVRGRTVALLLGDDGVADVELAQLADLIALVRVASAALERIVLRKKRGHSSEMAAVALPTARLAARPAAELRSKVDPTAGRAAFALSLGGRPAASSPAPSPAAPSPAAAPLPAAPSPVAAPSPAAPSPAAAPSPRAWSAAPASAPAGPPTPAPASPARVPPSAPSAPFALVTPTHQVSPRPPPVRRAKLEEADWVDPPTVVGPRPVEVGGVAIRQRPPSDPVTAPFRRGPNGLPIEIAPPPQPPVARQRPTVRGFGGASAWAGSGLHDEPTVEVDLEAHAKLSPPSSSPPGPRERSVATRTLRFPGFPISEIPPAAEPATFSPRPARLPDARLATQRGLGHLLDGPFEPAPIALPSKRSVLVPGRHHTEIHPGGADVASLLHRYLAGGSAAEGAMDELVVRSELVLPLIVAAFPGPLLVDRHRARAELPLASQCGPLLRLLAAMRRPALSFVVVRSGAPDTEVRFWSTHLLGELLYPESASALLPRLFDADVAVRRIARRASASLLASGAPGLPLLQSLATLARDPYEALARRLLAIDTMGDVRVPAMVPPLLGALGDPANDIREAARRALLLVTRQDFGHDIDRWVAWWREASGRHRVEWLIDALMHPSASIRSAAGDELKLVTKEYYGYYDDLPERDRKRAQDEYHRWWHREGRQRFV